jgi:hypothetical protein
MSLLIFVCTYLFLRTYLPNYLFISLPTYLLTFLLIYLLMSLLIFVLIFYVLTYLHIYFSTYLPTHLPTSLLIYLLTSWSRVLPEKLKSPQLVRKFPAFYGARRLITAFTIAHHVSLFWARSIHFVLRAPSLPPSPPLPCIWAFVHLTKPLNEKRASDLA